MTSGSRPGRPQGVPELPGSPASWREFRSALKLLMARAELTAVAVERMSAEPAARAMGVETIADATVGRKIADREQPVDARSVRTIVTACELAARRRGESLPDADLQRWLAARTHLAERAALDRTAAGERPPVAEAAAAVSAPGDGGEAPDRAGPVADGPADSPVVDGPVHDRTGADRSRGAWLTGPVTARRIVRLVGGLVAVILVAAATAWAVARPDPPAAGHSTAPASAGDALVTGTPPCRNPPDKPTGANLAMTEPQPGTLLTGDATVARGTVSLGPDERPPWLMLYAVGVCKFYLVAPVMVDGATWSGTLYADPTQHGSFVAYVVAVGAEHDARLHAIASASRSPFIVRLPTGSRVVHVTVRCCR
ncbi:MAG TPA: hypothetical protein VES42_11895 [Pilimelia sp.]|nr:hypothetical protein [Pilimelia sp.]